MRRMISGRGILGALGRRRTERRMSRVFVGLLGAVGMLAVLVFLRELPSLRRYMRIERM